MDFNGVEFSGHCAIHHQGGSSTMWATPSQLWHTRPWREIRRTGRELCSQVIQKYSISVLMSHCCTESAVQTGVGVATHPKYGREASLKKVLELKVRVKDVEVGARKKVL